MSPGDIQGDGQTESRPLRLCGEKRLEQPPHSLGRNGLRCLFDVDPDRTRACRGGAHHDAATGRGCVYGVHHQVNQGLVHLGAIDVRHKIG